MKRILFSIIIICCMLFVISCDLSSDINQISQDIYNGIKDVADPYLSEAGKKPDASPGTNQGANPDESTNTESEINGTSVQLGTEIGNKLPAALLQTFDENGLTGSSIDPIKTGKVTVINFWGTWCGFCLDELPHFSLLATEYKENVTFVAIHSVDYFDSSTNGAVDYVKDNYSDSDIIFAKDTNSSGGLDDCYTLYGGDRYYPYTIIIDENGIITFKKSGVVSESDLRNELDSALDKKN